MGALNRLLIPQTDAEREQVDTALEGGRSSTIEQDFTSLWRSYRERADKMFNTSWIQDTMSKTTVVEDDLDVGEQDRGVNLDYELADTS